jgi:Protein of unknown function (DUF3037)
MVTKYSVVRYLPNPLSGEMINIGVIAWGEDKIAAQFAKDWRRAKAFGREDISFLRDFVEQIEASAQGHQQLLAFESKPVDTKQLEQFVKNWGNSIQFSELRTSLLSPEEVISEISSTYLPELPHFHSQKGRTRHTAAMLALQRVSRVLIDERGPRAGDLIKKEHGIRGKIDEHLFDVVVANGRPFLAAQGLSFEKTFTRAVQKDVDATAWAIDDVRKAHRHLPMAILALSPEGPCPPVERARKIFRALDADMISEQQIDRWAKQKIRALPVPNLAAHHG